MGNVPPSIMRQPPQPQRPSRHHRSQMPAVKEEPITEMVGGDCSSTYYHRRCKRKRSTDINSLPDEMLFEVLIRLPAQDIHDHARFVCRKWCRMIHTRNFINAHLHHTPYGVLLESFLPLTSFMAPAKQGQIEISKFRKYDRWDIAASCNGLVLGCDIYSNATTLYIKNPITKHIFALPPLYRWIQNSRFQGIAYVAASMEYKVVSTSYTLGLSEPCAILTVGVDKSWRIVRTEHLSFTVKRAFISSPHITEGFMHWMIPGGAGLLTLNVETELITETPRPPIPRHLYRMFYLSGGRYISLLIDSGEYSWEVFEMKPESGKWRKLPEIAIEAHKLIAIEAQKLIPIEAHKLNLKPGDYLLRPFCWLKYLEVLVFKFGSGHDGLVYNLCTQEIDSIELPTAFEYLTVHVHKSSLEWLGGC